MSQAASGPWQCPACRGIAQWGYVCGRAGLACSACGGLWLDAMGVAAVQRRAELIAMQSLELRERSLGPNATACPVCPSPLSPAQFVLFRASVCRSHGGFFTREDLSQLVLESAKRLDILDVALRIREPAGSLPKLKRTFVSSGAYAREWNRDPWGCELLFYILDGASSWQ